MAILNSKASQALLPARKSARIYAFSFALLLCGVAWSFGAGGQALAQSDAGRKKVTSDADLPRISYPVKGSASDLLLADDATFGAFAAKVGADADSILANYDIEDKTTLRRFLSVKANAQMLAGDPAGALKTTDRVRDLEEKPDAKLTSGLLNRPLLEAWVETGSSSGPAFQAAFQKDFSAAVNGAPWAAAQQYFEADQSRL